MSLKAILLWLSLLVIVLVLVYKSTILLDRLQARETFAGDDAHFKYGSIGSDNLFMGVPYLIWRVLPEMFPEYLPKKGKSGYENLGLIAEQGMDRPIGFSKSRLWKIEVVGLNCAFCHVSTLRKQPDQEPEIVVGMPGNGTDIESFFLFLFDTAADPRFTVSNVMERIEKIRPDMGFLEKLVYPIIVYVYHKKVLCLSKQFQFLREMPKFGPGRVETWTPYKRTLALPALPVSYPGIADFPSVWNQKVRADLNLRLHWDGNNANPLERNLIAAAGVVGHDFGALDFASIQRVGEYLRKLKAPKYSEKAPERLQISSDRARDGKKIYQTECADCHEPSGRRFNKVIDLEEIGTDPNRVKAFTQDLADQLNTFGTEQWKLRNFKKTNGYVSTLLDGVWLRAPYLHNGSVPTLRDLLKKPEDRPKQFCRGNDLYDWANVGFTADADKKACGNFFSYSTDQPGNSPSGHDYGTNLSDRQVDDLLEYLKTL